MLNIEARTAFGADHHLFRDEVRKFIAREIMPHFDRWEREGNVDRALWKAAGAAGLLCPGIPEAYGGLGLDFRYNAVIRRTGKDSAEGATWTRSAIGPTTRPNSSSKRCGCRKRTCWAPRIAASPS